MLKYIDLIKSITEDRIDFARIVSHLSFGFLIFFIGLNHNFSIEKDFNMKVGETKNFDNYKIEFKKYDPRVKKHVIYKEEKIK